MAEFRKGRECRAFSKNCTQTTLHKRQDANNVAHRIFVICTDFQFEFNSKTVQHFLNGFQLTVVFYSNNYVLNITLKLCKTDGCNFSVV